MVSATSFSPGDALMIVDLQNDFCPGGALPIEAGDRIVAAINAWIEKAVEQDCPVLASRDWHPKDHLSFKQEGGKWPPHCIQDTPGARFHKDLKLPASTVIVTKGVRFDQDQNSAFDQTGLEIYLKRKGIRRLFIAGLALDVCVLATAMDARRAGLGAVLITEATRPVQPDNGSRAISQMRDAGVVICDHPAEYKDETEIGDSKVEPEDVDICLKAPEWAEHQRFNDNDMDCDDGRAG